MLPPTPQRKPTQSTTLQKPKTGIAAISPEWAKLMGIDGETDNPFASNQSTQQPYNSDYVDVLRGLASQTQQPYKPGWAALPGVASSIVGGLAARKLKNMPQQRDEKKQLQLQLLRQRLAQQKAGAKPQYGKTGSVFQDKNGKQYTVQFGSDGTRKILPVEGLTQSRGTGTIDTGTGTQLYDKATGQPVRDVGKNIADAESQKVIGREAGKSAAGLSKQKMNLESVQEQNKTVTQDIDLAIKSATGLTTGFLGGALSNVPGTSAYDLARTLDTIKANVGFNYLQQMRESSPTGGALGQVTERELALLQAVQGSIDQSQTKEQLIENLNRLKLLLSGREGRLRRAYEADVARFGAENVPNPLEFKERPLQKRSDTQIKSQPPPGAIQHLRDNPKLADQFDQKYGDGAAAGILNE